MDLYMREAAPLSAQEWEAIDEVVVATARANLVGRRFIHLYGPVGAGVAAVWVERFSGVTAATKEIGAQEAGEPVAVSSRVLLPLVHLSKDFRLDFRDIEAARHLGGMLDPAAAGAAAAMLARAEDELIFYGADGKPGLFTVAGRQSIPRGDSWKEPGSALQTIAQARSQLVAAGAMGPYAVVLSPDLYAQLLRPLGHGGRLELELIKVVADGGVYQSPVLKPGHGAVVSCGRDVLDIVVGEDVRTAYIGTEGINHLFRVLEVLALRIRRPEGICTLE